jgi:hypothetical protein
MFRPLPHLTAALALAGLLVTPAGAAPVPPGGTMNDLGLALSYTSGPLSGQNQTGTAGTDPVCFLTTCDDYLLTINISQGYRDAHPDDIITIKTQWPDPANDFDLYLFNGGGTRISAAATSDDPEIIQVPIGALPDGVYTVRMVAFDVTNETYTGRITLDPPPPPVPPAAGTQAGIYVPGTDVFSCNVHLTGEGHNGDGEPGVKVDRDGQVFVGSNAGVGAGIGVWKITDPCGAGYDFRGAPDAGIGGGDVDIEAATVRNSSGFYNIYTSSLALANIVSSVSTDGGATFTNTVVSDEAPVNDRQWNAVYGDSTIYLSFRTLNTGNQLIVYRSDFAGAPGTFLGPFLVYADVVADATLNTQLGSMAADQRPIPAGTAPLMAGPSGEGNVYHGFMTTTADENRIYVGVSRDFGVTWTSKLVFQGGVGDNFRYDFSWVTVDEAGNVYTAFSDQHHIYYAVSGDHGDHWSAPYQVSSGADNKSAVFVSMDAGSPGRVVFSWYGTSSSIGVTNPLARYHVFHARCNNALAPLTGGLPVFEQVRVSNHVVHQGQICLSGITCTSGRELLEDFEVGINRVDGSSVITYTDNGEEGGTYFARQIAGASAVAGRTVVDRSSTCARNTGDCRVVALGNPCIMPGIKVVSDDVGDAVPNDEQRDIESISIAEPYPTTDRLVFTMKVKRLDPNPLLLPQSAAWRMTWSFAGTQYFVRMLSCPTGVSYDYGTVGTTSTTVGPATAGTYSSDGTISITMLKSLIGNPGPGAVLAGVTGLTRIHGGPCPPPPGPAGVGQEVDAIGASRYTLAPANYCAALLGVPTAEPSASTGLSLALSGANPFRGNTTVAYVLPARGSVRVDVYSVTGQRVRTLVDGVEDAGSHTVPFALRAEGGRQLGAGVYLITIAALGESRSVRAIALE